MQAADAIGRTPAVSNQRMWIKATLRSGRNEARDIRTIFNFRPGESGSNAVGPRQ
jgi:hypothetical protein